MSALLQRAPSYHQLFLCSTKMKLLVAIFTALFAFVAAHGHHGKFRNPSVPGLRTQMIYDMVTARNGTIAAPESVKCDVCKWALGKAYSVGCGKAGGIIADLCGDFAPLCDAALDELCKICETHCDVDSIIDKACTDVHLC